MIQRRNSRQRDIILKAVKSRCDHPTADQIYMDVRREDDRISRGTVYRNLGFLTDSGDITNVWLPSADRYDLRSDRHYHLYCIRCGRVSDAPLTYHEEFDRQTEEKTGFRINRHRTVFEGLCSQCLAETEKQKSK